MTIKPYIFHNYEGSLPANDARGNYTAVPAGEPRPRVSDLEKIDGIQITIDLTDVRSKEDICIKFYEKLGFAKRQGAASWDALGDYLWFFAESSPVFDQIDPGVVHLRIININCVLKIGEKEYGILCEILIAATDNSRFDDGFRMLVEAINE